MRGSSGGEDHIVAAEVAVDDPCVAAVGGKVLAEPVDQRVHLRQAPGGGVGEILLRPARHLALDEAGGAAIIGEPDRGGVDAVELGDGRVHRVEVRRALGRRQPGEGGFPDDPAVDQVHDEEGRADDARILAQPVDVRDGEAGRPERAHHPRLALDRMRAGEQACRAACGAARRRGRRACRGGRSGSTGRP